MPTVTGVPHICVTLDTQSATPGVRPRRRDPLEAFNGSINYPLIKSWIDRCNDDHGSKCHERFVSHPPDLEIDLIDVSTRRLVRRTIKERYVALSYVWGKSTELRLETSDLSQVKDEYDLAILAPKAPATRGSLLPKEMPQTMEDAITFTKRLGERYLWVDVYCIDQNDEVEMRAQIGAMHRIFSSAYLTLLNVDGENADWGLTGVSRPILQTNQPVVETSEGQIMATFLYSIWHNAGTTVWDSRAWTLQERLLSLRSVIFAKTYIAMACQEEYFHDILHLAPDVRTTMGDDFFREDGADIHLDEPEWDFKIYDALVSVYSGRKLTVQSDALNACLGSLNRIALSTGYSFTFGHPEEDLLRSLLWKAHHEHVSTRRSEFPSWSWLGWRGRAEYPYWVGDMADYATDSPSPTRPPPRSRSHSGSVSSSDEKDLVTRAPPTKRRRLRWFTAEDDTSHPQTAEVTLAGKPSFNEPAGSLRLETMVATFRCKHIRHNGAPHKNLKYMSQQARLAVGEHWALLDLEGELLRNTTGEHPAFESTDVWFRVDAETSARLEEWDGEVQLVFVQQWPRIRDSKASGQWRWDMVSVLVALPGIENGHAMRIAAVLLERDEWLSRKPIPGTVILI
ncbi:uncharacterized protein HMPREF1541_06914 [Cyphellophora europaea CBS 101466]|uniref:Heterokaryon incompatibility domain-containing protein n=1 Tax=Cyphellophora europaea (strain CBS 101466) TaxID=1220924 RepID=W2RT24_CYPE1|nr:uncharacterized protein HMPREF1541_06914 [Cyphellophora europaea CBS 101466]ETN38873.1 hypothetical protein HMPREF1541_06914 [Cyphellophora europaea CBS 101466]